MRAINPYTNEIIQVYKKHTYSELDAIIKSVNQAWENWKNTSFKERTSKMRNAAEILRKDKNILANLITDEMGKLLSESLAEIEKCAWVCDYYAENAEQFLSDENIETDASKSFVAYEPLGIVLAVMPWNFPFWQVFRFAAPALMAGNAGLLKHASNVPGCALAIEKVFMEAGFPENIFKTLLIPSSMVSSVVENKDVKAVTLTGSEDAGKQLAETAGRNLKKQVLELGGSDPFIVLEDADIEKACQTAVTARMINTGQSCIAAKRFIVEEKVADEFENKILSIMKEYKSGDPKEKQTKVAPLARPEFVDDIDYLVQNSVDMGAKVLLGGKRPDNEGNFYPPTVLTKVTPEMPVFKEETFGPVMAVARVKNEEEAIEVANQSRFGLGGCVWTKDIKRGERVARQINTGCMFVNGLVKSDPRLPFGGTNKSGYGRELSYFGIREFVNIKTIWIA